MSVEDKNKIPRRIISQPYDFSVSDLVEKIKSREINLNPEYQRNYVWDSEDGQENKKSRLIESLLLNIPIPIIYFAETETLNYEVIDGQQRLQTFKDFLENKFALEKLEVRDDVNGRFYRDLTQEDKDFVRKRGIRAIVILNESDEQIKYEVFERLNLGSIQLTPQEIRNNTLRGAFNDLLKELAQDEIFTKIINLRLKQDKKNMAYEELILRFFAYHFSGFTQKEQFSYFLTRYMKENQNLTPDKIAEFRNLFKQTIQKVYKFLEGNAFVVFKERTQDQNKKSHRSLYDIEMLAFSGTKEEDIIVTPEEFKNKLKHLMQTDEEFMRDLAQQTKGKKLEKRINIVKSILLTGNIPKDNQDI